MRFSIGRFSIGTWALGEMLAAVCGLAAACGLFSVPAQARQATDLVDAGMEDFFGRYAPQGDCGKGPVIEIAESGFTFDVAGKTVHPTPFEIVSSYWGNSYQGIQQAFAPFLHGADYGASTLIVNVGEVEGKIAFEIDRPASAVEQALAKASPYMRCGAPPSRKPAVQEPAPVSEIPLDWAALPKVQGSFDVPFDMFGKGEIAQALHALIGGRIEALENNLSVRGPIKRLGSLYYISGNAPHMGGEEQAYVLMDAARKRVQVGLWEKGKLTVYAPPQGRLPVPADIAQMLIQSPPEDAVALPGTPWEVIYTANKQPLATVDAAGSPDIRSFSLFCDQGRPKLAMLLNKSRNGDSLTNSWVFKGRVVNVAMGRGNGEGTFWLGWLNQSALPQMLAANSGEAFLRIDGEMQGQASLSGSTAVVRGVLGQCMRF